MFSAYLTEYAELKFAERLPLMEPLRPRILSGMAACRPEEQVLLKFFYGTMPLRDAGEYEFDVFLGYVRHGLLLWEQAAWFREIPEDIFLNYILYYRVNSENIEDCRGFFYNSLKDEIAGLTAAEAVLAVNYWCARYVSYEASDDRTISPLTVYRCGKGRCGEESTFTVSALRSIGIPARQVYTPRWAHCDDNHAWVEAWLDGKWYFFGACEPEEVLNKGWFSNASSRALLVHTRTFSDFSPGEECIGNSGSLYFYNDTATYARTKRYLVQVTDENANPVPGAEVFVEILNMAEFCPAMTVVTDKDGTVCFTVGLGDIHLHVVKDDMYQDQLVSVKNTDCCRVVLTAGLNFSGGWQEIDVEAPADAPVNPAALTKAQKEAGNRKLKEANRRRKEREAVWFKPEIGERYPRERELLVQARGNFGEIAKFLTRDDNPDRAALLQVLSEKDYRDAKADVLEEHLVEAGSMAGVLGADRYDRKIYVKYILNPRIWLEEMTAYRKEILAAFHAAQRRAFQEEPQEIWKYIEEQIRFYPQYDYAAVCSTPVGCLKLKQGNLLSKKILFVAICRTLFIPARINKVNQEAEYYYQNGFCQVTGTAQAGEPAAGGVLQLTAAGGSQWNYYQNWTIGQFHKGQFRTLDYTGYKFSGNSLELKLEAGVYRLLTVSRMPNGNQHGKECVFRLAAGERKEMVMELREGSLEDMLLNHEIAEFELTDNGGVAVSMTELTKGKDNILIFLEEGMEPTEHVLNEMLAVRGELAALTAQIIFVFRDAGALQNRTVERVLAALPKVRVLYDPGMENAAAVARRMYVEPEKLPLLAATREGMLGIYGCSGYHVGSVELVLKILKRQ